MLAAAAVVPVLVFAALIVLRDISEQRQIRDQGMSDTVCALSLAIDGEVKAALAVLETLRGITAPGCWRPGGLSRTLLPGDREHDGAWLVLFDQSGQQIVNSSRPFLARSCRTRFVRRVPPPRTWGIRISRSEEPSR